jgi:shikimate dehydrogenase
MKKFGLIGFPLGHSFSKGYFTDKFKNENIPDCSYENFPLHDISELATLINEEPELIGLNITIPYKEKVISFMDEMDHEALLVGAVNTIKIVRHSSKPFLKGFNTDIVGFEAPLTAILKPFHKSALILGTGGASKAVVYVLKKYGIDFQFVSRKPKNESILAYSDLTSEIFERNKLIINTSPVGMFPDVNESPPIPYEAIGPDHIMYDLIYNPEKTLFLKKAEEKKAILINGLPMLYGQAERSWQIWNSNVY